MLVTVNVAYPGDRSLDREREMFVIRTDKMVLWCPEAPRPNPLSLVLASLGMCSGGELHVFCTRRDISANDVRLVIEAELDDATHRVDEIHVRVLLPESFPTKYVEPCERAVSQCSVKQHLERPLTVSVSTSVEEI